MRRFAAAELATLQRLRGVFLSATGEDDYWRSPDDLALYDQTFGARIRWKWDAVLHELSVRNWQPRSRHLFDWGCGSGIGSRALLAHWNHFESVTVRDRSPIAERFAGAQIAREHSAIECDSARAIGPATLVAISHVMNELDERALDELLASIAHAQELIWVEAATHRESRRLLEVRERLLENGLFRAIAPCTHQRMCGLLTKENARHWCHHFAETPREIFHDADWAHFSRAMGIDLRRTPYSFLVIARAAAPREFGAENVSRVIGLPRDFKGYSKVLSCQAAGVTELMLQKRDARELFDFVRQQPAVPLYRWKIADGKIVGGVPCADATPKQHEQHD